MHKQNIISFKNGKKLLKFRSISASHFITTNDFGSFRTENVQNNRNGFHKLLLDFFKTENFTFIKPEHADKIFWISNRENAQIVQGDGLIYFDNQYENERQNIIAANTGDCPYLLLETMVGNIRMIGIAHSGWRGTRLNIVGKMIKSILNVAENPCRLNVGLLSGICQNCYEVDSDVYDAFSEKYSNYFSLRTNGRWNMDLSGIIKEQIIGTVGFHRLNLEIIYACPFCSQNENGEPLLYSARRGEIERNLICMKL